MAENIYNKINDSVEEGEIEIAYLKNKNSNLQTNVQDNEITSCFESFYDNFSQSNTRETLTSKIFFNVKPCTRVKIDLSFDVESNFSCDKSIFVYLNDEVIFSKTEAIAEETKSYAVEYDSILYTKANNLQIKVANDTTTTSGTYASEIHKLKINLQGVNAKILSRFGDFWAIPKGSQALMSTHIFDEDGYIYISTQDIDENLSLAQSNFAPLLISVNRKNNLGMPVAATLCSNGVVSNSANFSIMMAICATTLNGRKNKYVPSATANNTTAPSGTQTLFGIFRQVPCVYNNMTTISGYTILDENGKVYYHSALQYYSDISSTIDSQNRLVDHSGLIRLGEMTNGCPIGTIFIDEEENAFLFVKNTSSDSYYKVDLGKGIKPNAYLLSDKKIVAYINRNNSVEELTLAINSITEKYQVVSSKFLEGISEYFKLSATSCIVRRGGKIEYYYDGDISGTPTSTISTLHCY